FSIVDFLLVTLHQFIPNNQDLTFVTQFPITKYSKEKPLFILRFSSTLSRIILSLATNQSILSLTTTDPDGLFDRARMLANQSTHLNGSCRLRARIVI